MRALQVTSEDGPDSVALADLPEPDGDFVIAVRAAGVTFPDLLMTRGEYQLRQPVPFILGWEAAGEVLRAPPDSGFAVGDRVVTLNFGAHAEQVAATPETTFALADELSFEEGAALPLNYLTALAALDRRGGLRAGERVLVHGAAGGVGTATVQIGKALGAEVIAVVSTEEKAEVARKAGADSTIVGEAFRESLSAPVNLIVDPVGGEERFKESLRSLAPEGRIVVVGFTSGEIPEVKVEPAVAAKRRCPRMLFRRARHRSRGRRQGCRTPDRTGPRRRDQPGGGVRLPARGDRRRAARARRPSGHGEGRRQDLNGARRRLPGFLRGRLAMRELPVRPYEMTGVAVRDPLQVVLMLRLGFPERAGLAHLGHDLARP